MATSSNKEIGLKLRAIAESAINSIGFGYDIADDLRLKYRKQSRLIGIDDVQVRDIAIPGGILVHNVSKNIVCDKGERMRFSSDSLSFQKMSEHFNQEVSLSSKIPTGHFNAAFEFTGRWQKDAANTKTLAFDGVFITAYTIALEKPQITLCDHIKESVPSSWDPGALASFIERFGTHVIVGVKMGGKDIVYMKQQHSSHLQPDEVQKKLKLVADHRFSDSRGHRSNTNEKEMLKINELQLEFMDSSTSSSGFDSEDVTLFYRRRGGSNRTNLVHDKWCQSVQLEPDVISMSFIPISSLLSGINGNGFLTHAINLYLRYLCADKPPIEELYQFLDFQHPRQWAPVFGELAVGPEGKLQRNASLQFSFLGPKLYVNTTRVDAEFTPVTGLRLYLEGKKSNCLAIHLQHLTSLPTSFQLQDEPSCKHANSNDIQYYEKVQSKSFSHVCTAPVESDDHSIVTGAQFEVRDSGRKRVLFLRLHFSQVIGATVVKQPEWDGSPVIGQKSGIISTLISVRFSTNQKPPPVPSDVNINSAIYPDGPPVAAQVTKLLKFVDTTEMTRGPEDSPGYWVVSGARLLADGGKIHLCVKYCLLAVVPPDEKIALP